MIRLLCLRLNINSHKFVNFNKLIPRKITLSILHKLKPNSYQNILAEYILIKSKANSC